MPIDDDIAEIHRAHREGQQGYTYFLLSASGAAIGFAVVRTDALALSWWLLPVGLAILSWGLSFYCGCKNLVWVQSSLYANFNLLLLRRGSHPEQPPHPELTAAAVTGVLQALQQNGQSAQFYAVWQFRLLLSGAVLFIGWRVIDMARSV
jgi:hypothetical protein